MLLDDHHSFRQPLALMLGWEPDITVAAQAGSLAEAREALRDPDFEVDVAIVDLDLPDGSGTEFVADLHVARPGAMTLVLSAFSEQERIARAIKAGAAGVMHKSENAESVVEGIRRLHAGEQLISQQEVADALWLLVREQKENRETRILLDKLTPREREVLQALAEGLSDKEIAKRLYVSVGTARNHIASILAKLEVQSRLQALVFAVRHDLVKI
jgi:DNA-binding NarL/FixJ family response regulator